MEVMEIVDNEPTSRPFKCDWNSCFKSFNRKSDLQRHYRIHTNDRQFDCTWEKGGKVCGKSFIQRSALKVHIRTHTGEKPHHCQHLGCGKSFSDSSSLARHRRIHTGKRPYKCAHDGCFKSFCRKTTMVKHQRRSHQRGANAETNDFSESDDGGNPPTPEERGSWSASQAPGGPPNAEQQAAQGMSPFGDVHPYFMSQYGGQHGRFPTINGWQSNSVRQSDSVQPMELPGASMYGNPAGIPDCYRYVPEQDNPGIATLNTDPMQQCRMPKQQSEQPSLENPYAVPDMVNPIQNSHGGFTTPVPGPSPSSQGGYYGRVPPHTTAYSLGSTPAVYPPKMHFFQQVPQPDHSSSLQSQVSPRQHLQPRPSPMQQVQPQAAPIQQVQSPGYDQSPPKHENEWIYPAAEQLPTPYQPPAVVSPVFDLRTFGLGGFPWAFKPDLGDPSMQMPSDRINEM
ncbi:uncharacterized protein F4812DRAFT_200271 [Daldinia caldariorum]|uniref:uncharacterized protein n=1 Tax=Daldinia caldariorum TaxID=326644 RepID=UPI00200724C6|nr:uncharacterized protein F4812DRAFT_200271 [Daldinia caldariorum]KAI1471952.1 hypothetical protein F4812DRAFT_200271 [Daldinia caldariorum]